RHMLMAALGFAVGRGARAGAAPAQPATPVNFDVPAGACDCHTHVFGDPARFAFAATRSYTPDALRQLGASARGVAVIDDTTPDTALDEMHRAGIRGIRLNLETGGVTD